MSLAKQIIAKLKDSNVRVCEIVINSQIFMHSGKVVYCELAHGSDHEHALNFFTKRKVMTGDEWDTFENGYEILDSTVRSTSVFGMNLPIGLNADPFTLEIYPEMKLLVVESQAYAYTKEIAERQIECVMNGTQLDLNTVNIPDAYTMSLEQLAEILSNFWHHSRVSYRDFVYKRRQGAGASRFVKRLYNTKKVYSVMDTFIPVFVDTDIIFNPLRAAAVMGSDVYKLAIEKNRCVSTTIANHKLSALFLTQTEICEALHMSRFMRFTPAFFYDIFMGLVYPETGGDFPSISSLVYSGPDNVVAYGLPRIMSEVRYLSEVDRIRRASAMAVKPDFSISGVHIPYDEFSKLIGSYQQKNSLWVECQKYADSVTHMGAYALDEKPKPSVETIYNIVAEARL